MIAIRHRHTNGILQQVDAGTLREANLRGVDLRGAELRWAELSGVDLSGVDLSGVDLSGAELSGANLRGANLRGAELSWAELSGVDLSGAELSGADLRGAELSGADLSGADLSGARINNAIGDGKIIRTMQPGTHTVTVCDDLIAIGGKAYRVHEWANFDDDAISRMDRGALDWWRENKSLVMAFAKAEDFGVEC